MDLNWTAYNPGTPADRVLLVGPSLGGNAAHQWTGVAAQLIDDARVIFVDLPGTGLGAVWDDADERALAVARLLADTAERLVRDTRRLNAAADLDLQVAKAALAQTTAADDLEALYTPGARP